MHTIKVLWQASGFRGFEQFLGKLCGYTVQSGNVHSAGLNERKPILTLEWFHAWKCLTLGSEFNPVLGGFSCETNRNLQEDLAVKNIISRLCVTKRTTGSCRRNDEHIESSKNSNLWKRWKYTVHHVQSSVKKKIEIHSNSWKMDCDMASS